MARADLSRAAARTAARTFALAVVLLAVAPAGAQGLRTLHVEALSMRADRAQLQVGEVFHLAIHVHVAERVAALDELVVPNVGTMQLDGDERRVGASVTGTDVVETLTLEPTAAGTYSFNAAYLDAIDARTRKPTRFSSNPVRVVVAGPALAPSMGGLLWRVAGTMLLVGILLVALVAVVVALIFRRRRPAVALPVPVTPPPAAAPPRTARDDVADALRAYRTAPGNGALLRLRGALFAAAGAAPGATLRDALRAGGGASLRAALSAAERTAFGPAAVRDASSAELIDATESWLR
jgi:hypothetical protein